MKFYLGTHQVDWLRRVDIPLFVSDRRLRSRVFVPVATCDWALDSGGFTEVSQHGRYLSTPLEYANRVRRYGEVIGRLQWAAPQDWMCEPFVLKVTGLTVEQHQWRTAENYCELRRIAPDLSFVPVLQGWEVADYVRCIRIYERLGVDLESLSLVGVGSVCRRQGTSEGEQIFRELFYCGLKLHGFGLKIKAIRNYGEILSSSDSLAWSYRARRSPPLPGCTHKSCSNCLRFALDWLSKLPQPKPELFAA